MLSEIRIQDFAIIDQLEVSFAPGFNVITGETGAGKSILIDAVDLVLGGRADTDSIRAGTEKAVVEAVFRLPQHAETEILPLLEAEGIEQGGELQLTRELRSNGRSVCRINGSSVNLQFYRDIGQRLVDVHGQSEHLSLLRQREHVFMLDSYANLDEQRGGFSELVGHLAELRREIGQLEMDEAALARRIDMLGYQIEEIRAVNPQLGEEEALREESARLANSEQLASLTGESIRLLDDDTEGAEGGAAVDRLNQVAVALAKVARIDSALEEYATLAESLALQAEEMVRGLRHYAENVEHNPARLNEVEERVDALTRLKRKYGGSIEAVLAYAEKARQELDHITHSEARLAELREAEDKLLHEIGAKGQQISAARRVAAEKLSRGIVAELGELRMEGTRFEVLIEQHDDPDGCYVGERRIKFDESGIDYVEFMLAANRGEPLRPLAKVASGGETARIMLSLKTVLSRVDETPTLIFDEIDQGIGGRIGSIVGQKLWRLSDGHQVLCVTHLAQIAGFGDAHFRVAKGQRADRTVTSVTTLNDRARVDELAEMLGAETVSAKQSAHDLLMLARQVKEGKGIQPALM